MTTLSALIKLSGKSTNAIAREVAISQPWLSRIENLKAPPGCDAARKLEKRFGLPIDTLLAEAGAVLAVREP